MEDGLGSNKGTEMAWQRWQVRVMTHEEALEVARWRYPSPYDFYNWDNDPEDLQELLEPPEGVTYWTVSDQASTMVGFLEFQFKEGRLHLGLGMRPDLTGKGLGLSLVARALRLAEDEWGVQSVDLLVAEFNVRAITVYRRAGFTVIGSRLVDTNGASFRFVAMRWTDTDNEHSKPAPHLGAGR